MTDEPRKNILFLFPDQHRGDWLPYDKDVFASMGNSEIRLRMPNLRGLMERGTSFTRAVTNSPLCVPARACLAAGMHYHHCRVYNNDFCYPLSLKTFYSALNDRGYGVGGVGKFDIHKPIMYWGKDGWIDQLATLGFTHGIDSEGKYDLIWSSFHEPKGPYSNYLHGRGLMKTHAKDYIKRYFDAHDVSATPLPEDAYSDNWVANNALAMMDALHHDGKPWFLQVNFTGPHNPWDVTEAMKRRWEGVDFPLPAGFTGDRERWVAVRRNYAAMLENIDRNIGLLLDKLRHLGQLDNTLIVYASDHGEMLGDRGRYFKCVPYRGSIHIPLVACGPGVRAGAVCDELVELHDLAATFVDFGGGVMPEGRDAVSLLPLMAGQGCAVREEQLVMLANSVRCTEEYADYPDYLQHKKRGSDNDYIEEYNREFGLEPTSESAKKHDFKRDWRCLVNRTHKLVEYADGEIELYDIATDPWESRNLAGGQPELAAELRRKLPDWGIAEKAKA